MSYIHIKDFIIDDRYTDGWTQFVLAHTALAGGGYWTVKNYATAGKEGLEKLGEPFGPLSSIKMECRTGRSGSYWGRYYIQVSTNDGLNHLTLWVIQTRAGYQPYMTFSITIGGVNVYSHTTAQFADRRVTIKLSRPTENSIKFENVGGLNETYINNALINIDWNRYRVYQECPHAVSSPSAVDYVNINTLDNILLNNNANILIGQSF